jgi:hypothetical protein
MLRICEGLIKTCAQAGRPAPLYLFFAILGAAGAQQVVAPTPEQVGPPRGDNVGNYNITQSFETGYRFSEVSGDIGQYRSVVNYGNGIRLLGSSLSIYSKDGHGQWFDEILLNTIGLGNDPYQNATLRVSKNGLYQYNMTWRLDDYYNPGLTVSGGQHLMDTTRTLQDHDLTILPQGKIRFHLGYSRNSLDGPALSTAQEFNTNGEAFPVFENVKQLFNEFRLGADGEFAGFHFTILHRWENYKDDSPFTSAGQFAALNPNDSTVLQQFTRPQRLHGNSPTWMGNLFTHRKLWGLNARAAYTKGTGDFALNEFAGGIGQFGSPATRQIAVGGDAVRPDFIGDLNLNVFPTTRLTVTNYTSVNSNRVSGDSVYSEVNTGLNLGTTLFFQYLGVRTLVNSTDADYTVNKWIGFYAGYHYSDRSVTTIQGAGQFQVPGSFGENNYEVTNILNSGVAGVRVRPIQPLTINLEGEVDRSSHPLTPQSPAHFHTLNGRASYHLKNLRLSGQYKEIYNANPQFGFLISSSHSRNYNGSASWTPHSWLTLDASYSQQHIDSTSFLAFFSGLTRSQLTTGQSIYLSNIHSGSLGVRFEIGRRADLYVGYSIVKDTGDGRATPSPAVSGIPLGTIGGPVVIGGRESGLPITTDPTTAVLESVQTFPVSYQSPLARFSFKISPKVRWNFGWQFYNYNEQFQVFGYNQNFHANTGYSSVLWSF